MSTSDNHPGVSFQEASSGVQSAQAGNTPVNALPTSGEGSQTSEVTSSFNNPNPISVSPPLGADSIASSTAVSNNTMHKPSLSSSNGNQANQEQRGPNTPQKVPDPRKTGTYSGALIMTATVVPIVAALISALAFIVHWPQGVMLPDWLAAVIGTPLLLGTVPTLIAWLLLAFIIKRYTAVDRMNMGSYGQLLSRLSSMDSKLKVLHPEPLTPPTSATLAVNEVSDSREAIRNKLGKRSLAWVTASGYIDLWQEMDNAEESLINMLPREDVIADALYDEMRIKDSNMDTSDALLDKLRWAVAALDPFAKAYLQSPPSKLQEGISEPPPATGPAPDEKEKQPRSVLHEVRHALNEFRASRWEAMVRVRNQFVCTMILTGITLYVLLEFALLSGAPQQAIIAATAYFLVGALVGLFNRLYTESQTSKSIDDYRLALARLAATPMYSGLAAVGGVIVVQQFTSLLDILSPKNLLSGLIVAAVFGLTPGLLITRLQNQTEMYKNDLKSTDASQGQATKTS